MICPNPNCKSIIPDDSKFCPDCGTPVKNEKEIRMEASQIVSSYRKGYDYFVANGSLALLSSNSSITTYENIIAKKQEIITKHKEILVEEQRRQQRIDEEARLRRKAEEIRQQCKALHPSTKPFILMLLAFGASTICFYMLKDNNAQGTEALLSILPGFVLIFVGAFFCTKALMRLNDSSTIDKAKVRRWVEEHPNDPVCKYL